MEDLNRSLNRHLIPDISEIILALLRNCIHDKNATDTCLVCEIMHCQECVDICEVCDGFCCVDVFGLPGVALGSPKFQLQPVMVCPSGTLVVSVNCTMPLLFAHCIGLVVSSTSLLRKQASTE